MPHRKPSSFQPSHPLSPLSRRALLRAAGALAGTVVLAPRSAAALMAPDATGPADHGWHPEDVGMGEDPASASATRARFLAGTIPAVAVPPPPIVTRAEWGADETLRSSERSFAPIAKLVVHHTATPNNPSDPSEAIRNIYRFHVLERGYADIAYNFLIDPAGRVYEGRWARNYGSGEVHSGEAPDGRGVVGAHTANYNTGSCGVALIGDHTSQAPTGAAVLALVRVLAWKAGPRGIDATAADPFTRADGQTSTFANVPGHRDLVTTACPGGVLYGLLPSIRQRVRARTAPGLIGYRILSSDGRVSTHGGAFDLGDPARLGARAATAITPGPDADSYWVMGSAGEVYAFGNAAYYGALADRGVRARAVDITSTPTGRGYWILTEDGSVHGFGDAPVPGSLPGAGVAARAARLRSTPSGAGYWILGTDGGIFCFGDAPFLGSVPGVGASTRAVDLASTPSGRGYWVLGEDGGVFCFGDAPFHGSVPGLGIRWSRPARALMVATDGGGYHVLANDGGVFSFGNVPFHGSIAGSGRTPVSIAPAVQH